MVELSLIHIYLEVGAGFEKSAEVEELGKDLAMQVAALNPQFLDKSEMCIRDR